jgi:hypothetical protein
MGWCRWAGGRMRMRIELVVLFMVRDLSEVEVENRGYWI